jgi:hypothetical protein
MRLRRERGAVLQQRGTMIPGRACRRVLLVRTVARDVQYRCSPPAGWPFVARNMSHCRIPQHMRLPGPHSPNVLEELEAVAMACKYLDNQNNNNTRRTN